MLQRSGSIWDEQRAQRGVWEGAEECGPSLAEGDAGGMGGADEKIHSSDEVTHSFTEVMVRIPGRAKTVRKY